MNTKQLKAKILDLAIHGKLVPQNPDDEPASKLLEKIREEKSKLIAEKKIKADKNDSYIFVGDDKRHYEQMADGTVKDIEDEIPFELPEGWAWVRLQEIADIARGGSPRPIDAYLTAEETGINWIKIGDTKPGSKYIVSAKEKIKFEGKKHSRFVHAGDFLLTNSMSFGRPYILKIDGCIHDGWLVFANIKNCLLQDYLYYALSSKYIYDSFSLVAAGSTVKNLKSDTVKQVLFPLPPINEQKKILEEIERIITLIEEVENDKADLQVAIKQAKSKILDLAIHGKLVAQDPNDEPAYVLLEKLRAEKEAKIKSGELKRNKNDSYIYKSATDNCHYEKFNDKDAVSIEDEIPFEIPESWQWCRLPTICEIPITDGTHQTPTYSDKENGIPFLSSKDVTSQRIEWSEIKYITKDLHEQLQKRVKPRRNDILLAKNGTTGVAALVETDEIFDIYVTLALLRPANIINPKFLLFMVNSPFCKNQFNGHLTGIGVPNLHLNDICKTLIPISPISEQQRIVSKIEELFTALDQIQNNLV